jgi:hypothetical protein
VRAQGPPACAPGTELGVSLTAQKKDRETPAVATHEIEVTAEFTGDARRVSLTPQPGVEVEGRSTGGNPISVIAPNATSLTVTVSWRQATDPSNPESDPDDPATSCTASRDVSVALLPARASHTAKPRLWRILQANGVSSFAVLPSQRQANLSLLEISVRTTSRPKFPPASARRHTMVIPMQTADQVKYGKPLPGPVNISVAQQCRIYYITCSTPFAAGGAFAEVARLYLHDGALARGIERGDVNGPLDMLASSQPLRTAAEYGAMVEARPGGYLIGRPRTFGYDLQVRQSGRLIARARMAGRCAENRLPQGLVNQCRIARRSIQLR